MHRGALTTVSLSLLTLSHPATSVGIDSRVVLLNLGQGDSRVLLSALVALLHLVHGVVSLLNGVAVRLGATLRNAHGTLVGTQNVLFVGDRSDWWPVHAFVNSSLVLVHAALQGG